MAKKDDDSQAIRDKHYFEDGVGVDGGTPDVVEATDEATTDVESEA